MKPSRVALVAATLSAGLIGAAACSPEPTAPTVPSLATGPSPGATAGGGTRTGAENPTAVAGDGTAARRARLHAAAECIRKHGAPHYQDPLLTSDGYVYGDDVSLRGIEQPQMTTIDAACHDLIAAARFSLLQQGPPPPRVIAAGVKAARCMRAHGLPDYRDPTVDTPFHPGKGFGLSGQSLPAAGKKDPTVQRALEACRQLLDEEAALSSLGNLGHA